MALAASNLVYPLAATSNVGLTRVTCRVSTRPLTAGREIVRKHLAKLGPMRGPEITMLVIFAATALLWMTRKIPVGETDYGWAVMLERLLSPDDGGLHRFRARFINDATVAVGMAVLERGGNAFDAAVATAFTLQVVEPHLNGPGGDVPVIINDVRTGKTEVICGQGPAPAKATIAHYRSLGLDMVPGTGLLAACVPGMFDTWMLLLRDYGVFTVHFVGLPPGTSSMLIKFIPPETLRRFGGAERFAEAVDRSIDRLAEVIGDPPGFRRLLFGDTADAPVVATA